MIARLKAAARVTRWPVPPLDSREAEVARAPVKAPAPQPTEPAAGPAPTAMPDDAAAAVLDAIRAQKAAEGYAEGLARGREEGRAQGHDEGYAAARRAAEAEAATVAAQFAKVVETLGGQIKVLDDAVEDAVVALALELARRVVGAEVNRSRESLVGLIRHVLTEIPIDTGTPRILLHPDDLTALRMHMPEIGGKVDLVADDSIEPGGCRVLADGIDSETRPDRRWVERSNLFESDLTLASRWRGAMLTLFD